MTKTFVTFVVWGGASRDDTKKGHEEATVTYTRLFAYLNDLIWTSKSIGSRKVSPTRTERRIGTPSMTWKERNKTTPSGTRKPQKGATSGHTRQPEVDFFGFLGSGFAQIFGQTDSIRQKKLSSTHFGTFCSVTAYVEWKRFHFRLSEYRFLFVVQKPNMRLSSDKPHELLRIR